MRSNVSIYLRVLLIFITVASCEKPKNSPIALPFRIKKVTTTYSSSPLYSYNLFNYDDNSRLVSIVNYSVMPDKAPYIFSRTNLYYDGQGRLVKNENKLDPSINSPASNFYNTNQFGYDLSNNISTIKTYKVYNSDPSHPFLQEDRQLEYGNSKFPVNVTTKINSGSQFDPELYFTENYTYNGGNIVEIKRTNKPTHYNGYSSSTSTRTFQYDDKPYPFYGLTRVVFDERVFNKNNIIESYMLYTYDANGLLTKTAFRDGSSETLYEYETYKVISDRL